MQNEAQIHYNGSTRSFATPGPDEPQLSRHMLNVPSFTHNDLRAPWNKTNVCASANFTLWPRLIQGKQDLDLHF